MLKKNVFKNIMNMNFSSEYNSIFELIEENLHRVEFVKDHVGLKDFVFVAEKNADKFEFPCFACFGLNLNENDNEQNFVSMNQSLVYDLDDIYKHLSSFFEKRNDTLYLEIGFEESIPSQEDRFRVYKMLKNKEIDDIQEAISKARKFPSWYKAKFAKEIREEKLYLNKIEEAESKLLLKLKKDLLAQIDSSLLGDDSDLFYTLTNRYNKVCKEIDSL